MSSKDSSSLQSIRADFQPAGTYGKMESFLQGLRAARPMDLRLENWKKEHPQGTYGDWSAKARKWILDGLHYEPGPVDLQAATVSTESFEGFRREMVEFQSAPWSRIPGWLLIPEGKGPFPAVLLLHSWGGSLLLGMDRYVTRGTYPSEYREVFEKCYSGRYLAEDLARRGYVVLCIDAFHFGRRLPWNATVVQNRKEPFLPKELDPLDLDDETFEKMSNGIAQDLLAVSLKHLMWAGSTWGGPLFWDDSRSVDYLLSRPEVDGRRIGCVGHSGGGFRSHLLAALDTRIRTAVSSGWVTTGDWLYRYNFTGTAMLPGMLPGVWNRLDYEDLEALSAPRPKLVLCGREDPLFAPEGMDAATSYMQDAYAWSGASLDSLKTVFAAGKEHVFDLDYQTIAWDWFDRWLKQ